ncbi:NADH-quinone oxidoreductase subunit F, partial [Candidatus Hakubella thermalkaliphila]
RVGGDKAVTRVLSSMGAEDVIDTIKKSQFRGRGGAGFSTGVKWELCRAQKGKVKYLICNGDEGDPGAFMDRSVLEGDPHSVLEGMNIAAYAIGQVSEGFIYVRAEYPLAVTNLGLALYQAEQLGLLGKDILGSGFDFSIEIKRGAGAFVCGESTAMMYSIEGRMKQPHKLGLSLAQVYGVASFYSQFYFTPRGENVVRVCVGTACHIRGALAVLERFEKELGLKDGESTPDLKFTLKTSSCVGCCS